MKQERATLEAVQREVEETTTFAFDPDQYKRADYWEDATETGKGDCEDYSIAKLRKLLALGWPRADLRLAIVGVENPLGDHAVCCARDAGGQWWVLDERYPYVMAPNQLGYVWVQWGIGQDWTTVAMV